MKEKIKEMIGTPTNHKDTDGDGIINPEDCQPKNKKKQGNIHDIGVIQIKKMQGNIPNNQRRYDII